MVILKDDSDGLPIWKVQYHTYRKIKSADKRVAAAAIRNASSAYIKKRDVREALLKRDSHKCVLCGSQERLEIDHIVSVCRCITGEISLQKLNSASNLQVLCSKCNAYKQT